MKFKIEPNSIEYPYLAIFIGPGAMIDPKETIKPDDLYLISRVLEGNNKEKRIYAQKLFGGSQGYFITDEQAYQPVPTGYKVIIQQ